MHRFARALLRLSVDNPVLLKELRIGLRERRIFVVQVGFLLILGSACLLALAGMLSNNEPQSLPQHGREYFQLLFWVQLVLLLLVTPGLTCGSISGERERHSLDMVLSSRLTTGELAAGKLGFALYYILLLLFSSLPMASIVFFLGGVSPGEAAVSYLELAAWGMLAAQVGLFFSSRETRSNYATSQSYLMVILSTVLLPFYGALRMADKATLGAGGPEFHPIWIVAGIGLYLSVFLFIKTIHRLRPRALYLKLMGWSFILIYCLGLALMLIALEPSLAGQDTLDNDWATLAHFLVGLTLVFSGLFLNDPVLESDLEMASFRRSLVSRPLFWLIFLALGLASPTILDLVFGKAEAHFQLHLSLGLGVLYLLCLAIFVQGLQKVFPGRPKFAALYFVILSLLVSLPTLGLLNDPPGLFSGVYLSPFISIGSIWEPRGFSEFHLWGIEMTIASLSSLTYIGLAVVGTVLPLLVRRKSGPKPQ